MPSGMEGETPRGPFAGHVEQIAQSALDSKAAFRDLLRALAPDSPCAARCTAFRALILITERRPELLLSEWRRISKLLESPNAYCRYAAVHLIAGLAPGDSKGRFEKVFAAFFALLDDPSAMVAAHVAGVSGEIAQARASLRDRIAERLLKIDETHHDAEHRDVIKGHAIESFTRFFESASNRSGIVDFVRRQMRSPNATTKRKAARFLATFAHQIGDSNKFHN